MESREERVLDRNTLTMWITKSYMGVLDRMDKHSDTLLDKVLQALEGRKVPWRQPLVFLSAPNSEASAVMQDNGGDGGWNAVLDKTRSR